MSSIALSTRAFDSDLTLGQAVRLLREPTGMSARSLSLSAGLSESYVGKVEKGEIDPSLRAFALIVYTLGLGAREIHLLVTQAAVRELSAPATVTA